jgi:hypothetical protein
MQELLSKLASLEVELHHPGARCSPERLDELLHPEFREVGRSGQIYDRATCIRFLTGKSVAPNVQSDAFALEPLVEGLALLTYRSAHRGSDGTLHTHTLRSSLWQRGEARWQLRYHQGTPAAVLWQ